MTVTPETPDQNEILASIASSLSTLVEENRDMRSRFDEAMERIAAAERVERKRVEADRKRTRWYRITVAAVTLVLLTFGGILLDNQRAIRASEQKLCPIVGVSATGPRTSPIGEWLRDRFAELFTDYGCTEDDLKDLPNLPTPSPSPSQK